MEQHKFSEVFTAYNSCVAKLDEARQYFQAEITDLNKSVFEYWDRVCKARTSEVGSSLSLYRWREPQDCSTQKEGAWLSFNSGTVISLDIKVNQNFSRNAAQVCFETRFDRDSGRFMFQCYLENQNKASPDIDEKVIEIIRTKESGAFPHHDVIKNDTAILFKKELNDELIPSIHQCLASAKEVCEEAVVKLLSKPVAQVDG